MKAKKYLALALIMSALLLVGGCGESFPELTDEEYDQTVEFAVGLLMKYSNNDQSKLAQVDVKELKKQREKEARKAAQEEKKKAESEQSQTTQTQTTEPAVQKTEEPKEEVKEETSQQDITAVAETTPEEEEQKLTSEDLASSETENANEVATNDSSETPTGDGSEETTTNPNAVIMSSEYSQEIINGILLSYQGYSVSSTYPESSKSYVINADKGKKLLVLRFDLYNSAESPTKVNMIEKGILVQTILNGKNLGYNAVTFLPNDLTSFVGTIDSKAHESLVVLSEIDEGAATNIKTLGMIFNIGGKETEVILK